MQKLISQIIKFGFVGGLAFVIDYGVLILLTDIYNVDYLISSAIAFCVSVIFNYYLSVVWIFDIDNSKKKGKNFTIFIILSLIGLILTEMLMFLGTDLLHINYKISKIGATAIVMVYNFITRKLILEKK